MTHVITKANRIVISILAYLTLARFVPLPVFTDPDESCRKRRGIPNQKPEHTNQ